MPIARPRLSGSGKTMKSNDKLQSELEAMIVQAMQQPGVAEVAQAYSDVKSLADSAEVARQSDQLQWVALATDTAGN